MTRMKHLFYIDDKLIFHIVDKSKKLSFKLKLLNINGYVQYALTNYSGKI